MVLVLCRLDAEGMCVALALMMSACDCSDAEQPELITRQAVLKTADCIRITIELVNSDILVVASNRLELKGQSWCNVC